MFLKIQNFRWCQLIFFQKQLAPYCRANFSSSKNKWKDDKTYFVTTPIFYVNAAPHVGHLYSAVLADAAARWQRLKGQAVYVSTGTDEHGMKIQKAARVHNTEPQEYCDQLSQTFKDLFDIAGIEYNRFIRTSSPEHRTAVDTFWNTLHEGGHIYKGTYSGWYSVSDEAFLEDHEVEDRPGLGSSVVKVSKESGHQVTWTEETNYKFRLTNFRDDLIHWVNTGVIHPNMHEKTVLRDIDGIKDLSISRERSRLSWGITVPGDPSQTIYVWFDALINYLTVAGYPNVDTNLWPAIHIIGKDILRFHGVYWPAFLMAAGLDPPKQLIVHGHWKSEGVKMSKSLGNVVDPVEKMTYYGVEPFRYMLLRSGGLKTDGDFSDNWLVDCVNGDLANNLGNLLSRCTAPSINEHQCIPTLDTTDLALYFTAEDLEWYNNLYSVAHEVDELFTKLDFSLGIQLIFQQLDKANGLFTHHEPWKLSDSRHKTALLHVVLEALRISSILLQPIIPVLSQTALNRLGVHDTHRAFHHALSPSSEYLPSQFGEKVTLQNRVVLQVR